jgi:hypothetical protein
MVSVPPRLSVHPVIVGGEESVTVIAPAFGTFPLPENLVQVTMTFTLLMLPSKVIFVPGLSDPVTLVPAGSELTAE